MAGSAFAFGLGLDDVSNGEGVPATQTFRSLTDMQWGQFEEIGFKDPDTKKLQFDLTEGARLVSTTWQI